MTSPSCIRTASIPEPRIQGALDAGLDDRRSPSSFVRTSFRRPIFPISRTLSEEAEDELEARAGDSGYMHSCNSSPWEEEFFSSGDFDTKDDSTDFQGSVELQRNSPGGGVLPTSRSPTTEEKSNHLRCSLQLVSILAYLTTFGIIGVVIRYLLDLLFGPDEAEITSYESALFIDLPANMLGSFFMGWVGVVFKKNIATFSEHLQIGLSTGLMGSITTYASMMQRNLALMLTSTGWPTGLFGLLIGLYLAQMSLVVGEDSALLLLKVIERVNESRGSKGSEKWASPSPDNLNRRKMGLALFLFFGGCLWTGSVVLAMLDTTVLSRRTLWVACSLAPPGVWTRWYLARFNGQGIGSAHKLRWFPVGTFVANVTASSLEASLVTMASLVRKYDTGLFVNGIELGTLGCLSTVSTFVVEIQVMHQGRNRWRSYFYPLFSMAVSVLVGGLVYGLGLRSGLR